MRCVLCAAPPPPPQTLFLSTFVCCAKKTNTPVDFFLLKFYMRKNKKISAFFSCVHSSNDKKNDTNDEIWVVVFHTHNKNFSCPRFLRPGVVLLELCPPAFIHSSGALVKSSFKLVSSLSTQHAQYAHARRKGVIK